MKKTGLNGHVNDFSVDYNSTDVDDISDIQKYLMKKMTQYNKKLGLLEKVLLQQGCFFWL